MRKVLVAVSLVVVGLAGAVAGAASGWYGVAVLAVVLLVAAALGVVRTVYRPAPVPRRPRRRAAPPAAPAAHALDGCIGAVSWALRGPRAADTSLRPVLTRIADTLLDARTGRGLRADPVAARRLLGDELFAFVDPARAARGHDEGAGLTVADVDAMLARLEQLT